MIISKLLTPAVKANIKSVLFSIRRIIRARKKIVTKYPMKEFCSPNTDTFFGYYDVSPFNESNEILYIELHNKSKSIDVVVDSLDGKAKRIIASSVAWNWQQGADSAGYQMMKYLLMILDGHYINRIINVRNNKEKVIPCLYMILIKVITMA